MSDLLRHLKLRRVIDLAGTETVNGAAPVPRDVIDAMAAILPERVEVLQLQRAASETIARATGAEAGCVTGCAAAGITIGVAACMTGLDMDAVERLPDTVGLRSTVILQKGHNTNFGAAVGQMIRIAGAKVLEIGTATDCAVYQLRAALRGDIAAAVYVFSHHAVFSGLIPLKQFCDECHAAKVPVVVDAAAEQDWSTYIATGADLVVVSGHKNLAGPTSGIIMGKMELVKACLFQERGIGRPMKAGKESIVGAIAALERWEKLDHAARKREHDRLTDLAVDRLRRLRGLKIEREPDPTGQPFARVKITVDPAEARLTAHQLLKALAKGSPKIVFRAMHLDMGYFRGDIRQVNEAELNYVCDRLAEVLANAPSTPPAELTPSQRGDEALKGLNAWPPAAIE